MADPKTLSPKSCCTSHSHSTSPSVARRRHRAARRRRHRALHRPLSQGGHRQSRRSPDPRHRREAAYFRELVSRRETILRSIQEQGKLTDELKARIEATLDKSELEDLYLPYKPKRRTKATIAREKRSGAAGRLLWDQQPSAQPLAEFAATFVNAEKGVATVEEALEGARHIVAETISENADIRKAAAPAHVRRRRHRQQAKRRTPSTSRKSSRCITTTASR